MTREEAIAEIKDAFEPAFANYIITALTDGATPSDKERKVTQFRFTYVDEFYGSWYECSCCGDLQMFGNYCRNCGAIRKGDDSNESRS